MSISHKENHFVPRTYLRSWADNDTINTLNLRDKSIRPQPTSRVAKKKNLYTLPDEFKTPDPKIVEHIIFKIWEDRWPSVLLGLNQGKLTKEQTRDLKGFVIVQSFRTPKFELENRKAIQEFVEDKELIEMSFKYHYAILGISGLTSLIENCICQVLFIADENNLITSDNPSTHWIQEENNGNISLIHLDSLVGREQLYRNPNYKIICPVTPKHLVVLTPNLGIEKTEKEKDIAMYDRINSEIINGSKKMIEHTAHKVLFAKNEWDFLTV